LPDWALEGLRSSSARHSEAPAMPTLGDLLMQATTARIRRGCAVAAQQEGFQSRAQQSTSARQMRWISIVL
jgi:hypothetical protein